MKALMCAAASVVSAGAGAQTTTSPAVIRVVGTATVRTPPDVAILSFAVRGEGVTSDAAVSVMLAKRAAIDELLRGRAKIETDAVSIREARGDDCRRSDQADRLSTGSCAVKGFVASLAIRARVSPVTDAGTLLAGVSKLGGTDSEVQEFAIINPAAARREASDLAIADARRAASAIAAASGVRLGRLSRVEDPDARRNEIVIGGESILLSGTTTLERLLNVPVTPAPIETTVRFNVEFEIGGLTP